MTAKVVDCVTERARLSFKDSTSIWRAFQITYLAFTIAATLLKCALKVCGASLRGFTRGLLLQAHRTGNRLTYARCKQHSDFYVQTEMFVGAKCVSVGVTNENLLSTVPKQIFISTLRAVQRRNGIN